MIIYHKIRPYFPNFDNHTPKNKCLQNNLALMEDGKIGRWGEEVGRGNWECGRRNKMRMVRGGLKMGRLGEGEA